ncbi:hypothetical protein QBC47DRAFT_302551 [Echria macrotheca]|uniref:Rhodopsin domain-containing protein n=1 Tax=Echria macrotheca TaxID=438768 RepID=A0AAJ0BBC4_9PEZI|nr:hypothetical protein QBC47DRAFT_302551 [Echria macrotheca]
MDPAQLDHGTAGPQANAVAWTLTILAAAFLGMRIYCKHVGQRGGLWWDDWILISSGAVHLVACVLLSVMVAAGYGRHPWDVVEEPSLVVVMIRSTLTVTAAAWSKTAFGITMLRLGEGQLRWILWFVIVTLNIVSGLDAMMPWVACKPLVKSWSPEVDGTCMDRDVLTNLGYASGAYSAVVVFMLVMLMWPIIWKLRMPRKEKLGAGIAMSMGFIAGIMATVKTSALDKLETGDSYDAAHLSMLDSAEIAVTIMAASVPAMRVLFRDFQTSATKRLHGGPGNARHSAIADRQFASSRCTESRSNKGVDDDLKDDNSDRDILGCSDGKILRVDEIEVEYRSASEPDAYEMRPKTGN